MSEDFFQQREIPFEPSTIETIDMATYEWLKNMGIFTDSNEGWKRVPIIWVSTERARNVKERKDIRDKTGAVILPIITLKRTGFVKDNTKKGVYWAALERGADGGTIEISRVIQQEKSSNFGSADAKRSFGQLNYKRNNPKTVYETRSIPLPVYIDVSYEIEMKTEYQQQMNDMVTPFVTKPGGNNYQFIQHEGHGYELFIDADFSQEDNGGDLGDEERLFDTKLQLKVLGHIVGEGKNLETPKIVIRQSQVEVKIPRERVIIGDITDLDGKKIF